jgi:putative FmdB family regulatory protein
MPLYEYRCDHCGALTTALRPIAESSEPTPCDACGQPAHRIVSRPSVHRDQASKVNRLDPKYDRMVDKAMKDTQHAEPDRHLARSRSSD